MISESRSQVRFINWLLQVSESFESPVDPSNNCAIARLYDHAKESKDYKPAIPLWQGKCIQGIWNVLVHIKYFRSRKPSWSGHNDQQLYVADQLTVWKNLLPFTEAYFLYLIRNRTVIRENINFLHLSSPKKIPHSYTPLKTPGILAETNFWSHFAPWEGPYNPLWTVDIMAVAFSTKYLPMCKHFFDRIHRVTLAIYVNAHTPGLKFNDPYCYIWKDNTSKVSETFLQADCTGQTFYWPHNIS